MISGANVSDLSQAPTGAVVALTGPQQWPGLNTQGVTHARLDFAIGRVVPQHTSFYHCSSRQSSLVCLRGCRSARLLSYGSWLYSETNRFFVNRRFILEALVVMLDSKAPVSARARRGFYVLCAYMLFVIFEQIFLLDCRRRSFHNHFSILIHFSSHLSIVFESLELTHMWNWMDRLPFRSAEDGQHHESKRSFHMDDNLAFAGGAKAGGAN